MVGEMLSDAGDHGYGGGYGGGDYGGGGDFGGGDFCGRHVSTGRVPGLWESAASAVGPAPLAPGKRGTTLRYLYNLYSTGRLGTTGSE